MTAHGTTDRDHGEAAVPRPLTKTLSEQCLTPSPNVLGEVEGRLRVDVPPFAEGGAGWLMSEAADAHREEYIFSLEDGPDHIPTDFEGWMLEDFTAGLMSDERFFGIVRALLARCEALEREKDRALAGQGFAVERAGCANETILEWMTRANEAEAALAAKDALLVKAGEALKPFAEAYQFWSAAEGPRDDASEIDDQGKLLMGDLSRASSIASEIQAAKVGS